MVYLPEFRRVIHPKIFPQGGSGPLHALTGSSDQPQRSHFPSCPLFPRQTLVEEAPIESALAWPPFSTRDTLKLHGQCKQ